MDVAIALHGPKPSSFTQWRSSGGVALKLTEMAARGLVRRTNRGRKGTFCLTNIGYERCARYGRFDHPVIHIHWRGRSKRPL